jgi:uncharacterized coiled-coil DUF342 family protein
MSSRDEYVRKMQAKLEEWNTEIDELAARADKVKGDVRIEYNVQIEALKVKRADAIQKIEEFKQAGESAFADLKSGIDRALKTMGKAIDSAKSRFS